MFFEQSNEKDKLLHEEYDTFYPFAIDYIFKDLKVKVNSNSKTATFSLPLIKLNQIFQQSIQFYSMRKINFNVTILLFTLLATTVSITSCKKE